jgi:hypothetical protein
VWSLVSQLHGDVFQLRLGQTQSGKVLIHHGPVSIHHAAGLCQVCGRTDTALLRWGIREGREEMTGENLEEVVKG